MVETIILDGVDSDLAKKVLCEYQRRFGNLPSNPSSVQLELSTQRFANAMRENLPFLGWRNVDALNEQIFASEMIDFLRFVNRGEKLSLLGRTGRLDCTAQALTIQEALGIRRGWLLYTDLSPGGSLRIHTFLAKKFILDTGKEYYAIIDSIELLGNCGHGYISPVSEWRYPLAPIYDPLNK